MLGEFSSWLSFTVLVLVEVIAKLAKVDPNPDTKTSARKKRVIYLGNAMAQSMVMNDEVSKMC